ncbi:hypothetical protein VQ02_04220 [Methylobacterium variabile]|uniref:Uncharacterized protein n=1 Tax=Methylobacterium variabile TaxID=298794 RepID=A0A0J6T815_9HYPH|nr:hypothetical protein VQ02_04220 [Methylobacterium variabile]
MILAQFGAVCAVAGVVIGGCLALFFGNDLAKGLMWFVIENMPLRKEVTVVRLHDPLLRILGQDPGMDA